jgi:nicotinamidase-related amidase
MVRKMLSNFSANTTLLLIDIQDGFDDPYWGQRNNPLAEENAQRLLAAWRKSGRPVVHVQHLSREAQSPLRPELAGSAIKQIVRPLSDEVVIQKHVNSAFIGTNLENLLREGKVQELVLAGFTTDHCVSTTTRMAANFGFKCFLVSDATATFDRISPDGREWKAEDIHSSHLASLNNEFAAVCTTDQVIAWCAEAPVEDNRQIAAKS